MFEATGARSSLEPWELHGRAKVYPSHIKLRHRNPCVHHASMRSNQRRRWIRASTHSIWSVVRDCLPCCTIFPWNRPSLVILLDVAKAANRQNASRLASCTFRPKSKADGYVPKLVENDSLRLPRWKECLNRNLEAIILE